MAEPDKVGHRVAGRLLEVDVNEIHIRGNRRSADHAERDADLLEQIDPFVAQTNLHHQDAVD